MSKIYTKEVDCNEIYPAKTRLSLDYYVSPGALKPLPELDYFLTKFDTVCVDTRGIIIFGEPSLALTIGKVKVTVLDLKAVANGDITPVELRERFPVSQRVAIVAALDHANLIVKCHSKRVQRDPARYRKLITLPYAYAAGFASEAEYVNAETVVRHGDMKLITTMDLGKIAVSTAALLTALSATELQRTLYGDASALKEGVKLARERRKQTVKLSQLRDKAAALRHNLFFIDIEANNLASTLALKA